MSGSRSRVLSGCVLGCGGVALLMIACLGLGGAYIYHLWHDTPAGWQRVGDSRAGTTPQQRSVLAAEVEKRVLAAMSFAENPPPTAMMAQTQSSPHPPHSRTIVISNTEFNAWLEYRLPMWAANQGTPLPPQVSDIRYWPDDGKAVLGARVTVDDAAQVISVSLDIDLRDDGTATVDLDDIRTGQLPVPGDRLLDQGVEELRHQSSAIADTVGRILAGEPFDPVFRVDHQRHVRLVQLAIEDDAITLRFEATPPPSPGRQP